MKLSETQHHELFAAIDAAELRASDFTLVTPPDQPCKLLHEPTGYFCQIISSEHRPGEYSIAYYPSAAQCTGSESEIAWSGLLRTCVAPWLQRIRIAMETPGRPAGEGPGQSAAGEEAFARGASVRRGRRVRVPSAEGSLRAGRGVQVEDQEAGLDRLRLFLVCYELFDPLTYYPRVEGTLVALGAKRILPTQWVLYRNGTAAELREHLTSAFDPNDKILIVEVANWATAQIAQHLLAK